MYQLNVVATVTYMVVKSHVTRINEAISSEGTRSDQPESFVRSEISRHCCSCNKALEPNFKNMLQVESVISIIFIFNAIHSASI